MFRTLFVFSLVYLIVPLQTAHAVTRLVRVTPLYVQENPDFIQVIHTDRGKRAEFEVRLRLTKPETVAMSFRFKGRDEIQLDFPSDGTLANKEARFRFAIPKESVQNTVFSFDVGGQTPIATVNEPGGNGGTIYEIALREFMTPIAQEPAYVQPNTDRNKSPVSIIGTDFDAKIEDGRTLGRVVSSLQETGHVQILRQGSVPTDPKIRWAELRVQPGTATEQIARVIATLRDFSIDQVLLVRAHDAPKSEFIPEWQDKSEVILHWESISHDDAVSLRKAMEMFSAAWSYRVRDNTTVPHDDPSLGEKQKPQVNRGTWAFVACGSDTPDEALKPIRQSLHGLALPLVLQRSNRKDASVLIEFMLGPNPSKEAVDRLIAEARRMTENWSANFGRLLCRFVGHSGGEVHPSIGEALDRDVRLTMPPGGRVQSQDTFGGTVGFDSSEQASPLNQVPPVPPQVENAIPADARGSRVALLRGKNLPPVTRNNAKCFVLLDEQRLSKSIDDERYWDSLRAPFTHDDRVTVHIRVSAASGRDVPIKALSVRIKKELASADAFVVCVDHETRKGDVSWEQRVVELGQMRQTLSRELKSPDGLMWVEFDPANAVSWKTLTDQKKYREAAQMIEQFLADNPKFETEEVLAAASMHFDAAQNRALDGNIDAALRHIKAARHNQPTGDGVLWNEYLDGTEAFLRSDRAALLVALEKVSSGAPANQTNAGLLKQLREHFGETYEQAYLAWRKDSSAK